MKRKNTTGSFVELAFFALLTKLLFTRFPFFRGILVYSKTLRIEILFFCFSFSFLKLVLYFYRLYTYIAVRGPLPVHCNPSRSYDFLLFGTIDSLIIYPNVFFFFFFFTLCQLRSCFLFLSQTDVQLSYIELENGINSSGNYILGRLTFFFIFFYTPLLRIKNNNNKTEEVLFPIDFVNNCCLFTLPSTFTYPHPIKERRCVVYASRTRIAERK